MPRLPLASTRTWTTTVALLPKHLVTPGGRRPNFSHHVYELGELASAVELTVKPWATGSQA
nr:hypothetical protein pPsy0462b_00063 [Pseudomonas syringae]